jgi:Zn-dependent protease
MSFIAFLILIVSIIAHEVAHGIAALVQGDPTAKYAGRLTLNPIPHIDMFGSVLLPAFLAMASPGFMFGWAKPVPINPYNFRNQKWGEAIVAFAGPLTNLVIAGIFIVLVKFAPISASFAIFSAYVVIINVVLAIFNLIPIPPLDGSKILFALIPQRFHGFKNWMEQRGFIIGLIAVLIVWQFAGPVVQKLLVYLLS